MKRFLIDDKGVGTYIVAPAKDDKPALTSTIDVEKAFGYSTLGDLAKRAVAFAIGHVSRNATAGKMEDLAAALAAVQERHKALAEGKWSAGREGGEGESRTSLLAIALAEVLGSEPKDAAEYINSKITAAWDEADIPMEEDGTLDTESLTKEQISSARKLANAVRKVIAEDPAVLPVLARIKRERAVAAENAAIEAAKGKTSAFAK